MTRQAEPGTSWKLYAKIGLAFAVALALLVPLPSMMQDPGTNHGAIAFFGLLFGLVCLYGGWDRYKRAQLVRDTPTSTVRSLAVGAAEVKGEAEPVDEPLVSPLTNQQACMYSLEIEEYRSNDEGSNWRTVMSLSDQVPFLVDDGTGRVLVEPGGATLAIEVEERIEVDDGHEPPEELGTWAHEQGMVSRPDEPDPEGLKDKLVDVVDAMSASKAETHLVRSASRDRRYTEKVLAAGESTYVFGGAQRRQAADFAENERNLVVREHPGTGRFVVSDKSEDELLEDDLVTTAVVLAIALVFVPYGLVASLFWLGIL